MEIIGIDFGHAETSVGFVDSNEVGGNAIRVRDIWIVGSGEKKVSSAICVMLDGREILSPSTQDILKSKDFYVNFKCSLDKISSEKRQQFSMFLKKTYQNIIENHNNPMMQDCSVYIACPSGWTLEQREEYKKFAKDECEIPIKEVVQESRAAFISTCRQLGKDGPVLQQNDDVLVIDYGSSTIDFTCFCRSEEANLDYEPLHDSCNCGASQIEKAILEKLRENEQNENHIEQIKKKWGKEKTENVLLWEIRKQKEIYFSSAVPDKFSLNIDLWPMLGEDKVMRVLYSRNELVTNILKDYIDHVNDELTLFKEICLENKSISHVILTGGASRMFFFIKLVEDIFGVSRDKGTLSIDTDSSYTISRGIAMFGYLNEKTRLRINKLENTIEDFIRVELDGILRCAVEKAIAEVYCEEFYKITASYQEGNVYDGNFCHNLYALRNKFDKFLSEYVTIRGSVGEKVVEKIQDNVRNVVKDKLEKICNEWHYPFRDIEVSFKFDNQYALTDDTVRGILNFVWEEFIKYIEQRDFFGATQRTPYKDRTIRERMQIVLWLNNSYKRKYNTFQYLGTLETEKEDIGKVIREKIKDMIDNITVNNN